jgi:hypothetical protein
MQTGVAVLLRLLMSTLDATAGDVTAKDVILVTYLLHCFCISKVDLTSFKKLGVDPFGNTSQLWRDRMLSFRADFQKAALTWAGIGDGHGGLDGGDFSSVSAFWDGSTPPTMFSIPHLAAQDIVDRVPLLFFKD